VFSIKKNSIIAIDFLKESFSLCNLNERESQGFVSSLTKLRFIPYTRILVPFSLGRTIRGLSFKKNLIQDPYGKLAIEIFKGVDTKILARNILEEFARERKHTAADIVHLMENTKLNKYPAWAIVMPWEKLDIEKKFETYPDSFYNNRSSKGLSFENRSRLSIIEIMYSAKSVDNKINQMLKLYKSIRLNGLKKNHSLPKINILVKENEWRWFMGDAGNHRSYICACFDFEFFDARVSSIIKKHEVNSWPNVINGTYSVKEAEYIFDSYFDGSNVLRGIV
tara:strand:+ start:7854 stop:8693 length:840 start_codon:yes stop_codon:yes gene_type:complete